MRITHLVFAVFVSVGSFNANAKNLGEAVAEAGAEWIIGQWSAADNEGVSVSFEWALDKHVILVSFSSGETKARGMITFRAAREEILYVSADNRGATGAGHWSLRDGHPTLFYEHFKQGGETIKAGFVHKRVDENTLTIEIHEINDTGDLASTLIAAHRFVRKGP